MAHDSYERDVRGWGLVSLLSDLAHESVTALLPMLFAGMGAPLSALGITEGVADAVASLTKLLGGRIADRWRSLKAAAVAGYAITALAMPAVALVSSWVAVVALRALAWLGRGFRSPLRDTLLVRAVPATQRGHAFGVERAMDQLGAVLAPLCVFALVSLAWPAASIVALTIVPGGLAVLVVLLVVRERHVPARATGGDAARAEAELGPVFTRYLVAIAVFGCGDFAKTMLVLWAVGTTSATSVGTLSRGVLLYAAFNLVTVLGAWSLGRLSDRVGRKAVLTGCYVLGSLGAVVPVLLPPSFVAAGVALFLSGVLVGGEEAVERAWAADLAGSRHGRGFGLLHTVNGVGDLVASAGIGLLWQWQGPRLAFGSAAALMLAGAAMVASVRQRR